jgi:predicted O-methyltransferase YrrM
MKFETVNAAMKTQPWGITEEQGRLIYDFVLRTKSAEILELGTGVGTSACYMAAALDELGAGRITTIDRNPDLPEWVRKSFGKADPALLRFVDIVTTTSSYNDALLPRIEAQTKNGTCEPCIDFCYIDGAHTWSDDGLAFFLADKLLKPGGWMLFDDMGWTIAGSAEASKEAWTQAMSAELRAMMQVTKVFDLLVAAHPSYDQLVKAGDWGWAQKKPADGAPADHTAKSLYTPPGLKAEVFAVARKVMQRIVTKITGRAPAATQAREEKKKP